MKEVIIKRSTQICSTDLGGCGRVINTGEKAWKQMRPMKKPTHKGYSRRYLCKECFKKVSH